jgi:hypothetical protein
VITLNKLSIIIEIDYYPIFIDKTLRVTLNEDFIIQVMTNYSVIKALIAKMEFEYNSN